MSKSQKTPGPKQAAKRTHPETWKPRDPLARELFKARIHNQTLPEKDGWVSVCFSSFEDLNRFLRMVTSGKPEETSLDQRILLCQHRSGEPWGYTLCPLKHKGRPEIGYCLSVTFPASDLPAVLKRLQDANAYFDDLAKGL